MIFGYIWSITGDFFDFHDLINYGFRRQKNCVKNGILFFPLILHIIKLIRIIRI